MKKVKVIRQTWQMSNGLSLLFVGMREYKHRKRELLNAVLYLVKTGCQWRNLPHDFPPVFTVHSFYRRARLSGLWDRILEHLVNLAKSRIERRTDPSVNRLSKRENDRCNRAKRLWHGKKTKGVKRKIVTDEIGCFLAVLVHKANFHDTKSGIFIAIQAERKYPTIQKFCGDRGYLGSFVANVKTILGLDVDISEKIIPKGWKVVPKRWIVERTFA